MSISSVGTGLYQNINGLNSPAATSPVSNSDGSTGTSQTVANAAGIANNSSSLSMAISQALAQMNGGANFSSLSTPASQQSSSDFMSSLIASLQGSSSSNSSSPNALSDLLGYSSAQTTTPVQLDQSSATIQLQTTIQNLITQLDGNNGISSLFGGSPDSSTSSGLADLQQSFNGLVTASGGNPSQASLQSFLKTVAANIQGSMSIGSLFDTSA